MKINSNLKISEDFESVENWSNSIQVNSKIDDIKSRQGVREVNIHLCQNSKF